MILIFSLKFFNAFLNVFSIKLEREKQHSAQFGEEAFER